MSQLALSPFSALAALPRCFASEWREALETVKRYYRNPAFRRTELLCHLAYLTRSPEAICRRYLRDADDDSVQKIYGETFFTTLEKIADAANITASDVVYELGCGRGRGVFWLNAFRGCYTIGIDINRYFIVQARRIQRKADINGVEFVIGNVLDDTYDDANVIYLYGSAFTDTAIRKLVHRFKSLQPGTRVISVSYPLNPYSDTNLFRVEKKLQCTFPWGEADVYIQRKL